jgi:hypothetical protein
LNFSPFIACQYDERLILNLRNATVTNNNNLDNHFYDLNFDVNGNNNDNDNYYNAENNIGFENFEQEIHSKNVFNNDPRLVQYYFGIDVNATTNWLNDSKNAFYYVSRVVEVGLCHNK